MDPTTTGVCTPYPPYSTDGAPASFPPEWLTETVLALAHGIRTDDAFDRLPILADALEEAGCDDPAVLNHCRFCARHGSWCWVMEGILPLGELHWTGDLPERHAAAVAETARQGHPDDPDVVRRVAAEAEADARRERRDQLATRLVWGCGAVVVAVVVWAILKTAFRLE